MNRSMENKVENRKVWTAPELKKASIEQLTAHSSGTGADGGGFNHNKS